MLKNMEFREVFILKIIKMKIKDCIAFDIFSLFIKLNFILRA